jgi:hypothetical protein
MEMTRMHLQEREDTEMRKILGLWSADRALDTATSKTMRAMKTGKNGCT